MFCHAGYWYTGGLVYWCIGVLVYWWISGLVDWKKTWYGLSSFYAYPESIRNIMYTTNSIEGFNRQIRKATKTKRALPSEIQAPLSSIFKCSKTLGSPDYGKLS